MPESLKARIPQQITLASDLLYAEVRTNPWCMLKPFSHLLYQAIRSAFFSLLISGNFSRLPQILWLHISETTDQPRSKPRSTLN